MLVNKRKKVAIYDLVCYNFTTKLNGDKLMKIVFFGDSITDMGRSRIESDIDRPYGLGTGYVFFASGDLLRENPLDYKIINSGISGNRVVDLYTRVKADVWNYNPDVLSILIGVNDIWHEIGSKNGVEIERFETVYRMLIKDTIKKLPNVKLILLEPYVLEGTATKDNMPEFEKVYDYANVVKNLAEEFGLAFVPLQNALTNAGKKYGNDAVLYDGVHPSTYGSRIIADEWLKVFNAKIK